jgi:hypothetical protein
MECQRKSAIQNIFSQETGFLTLMNGGLNPFYGKGIFRPDIKISCMGSDSKGRDDHSLDHPERVGLQNHPVHKCTGISFIAVADDVFD